MKKGLAYSFAGATALAVFAIANLAVASVTGSLLPVSNGTYSQWTPSTGTSHSALVDESSCNGNTDYISTTTIGNRDSYNVDISAVPDGAVISSIDITPCASKNSSGGSNSTMNVFYIYNGVKSADAGSYSVGGTSPVNLSATSFSSLNITKNSGSALEIGAIYSSGTKGLRLSREAVVITYETAPSAPSSLSASGFVSGTTTKVSLTWQDNSSNETGFKIERSTDNVNFSLIATLSANATSTINSGLSNIVYYYKVYAYNTVGNSAYSNTATVDLTLPSAPSSLTASQFVGTSTTASLTWVDNSTNEIGFKIEKSTDGVNFTLAGYAGVNSTTTNIPTFSTGIFYFRVQAYNNYGSSDYSNIASVDVQ